MPQHTAKKVPVGEVRTLFNLSTYGTPTAPVGCPRFPSFAVGFHILLLVAVGCSQMPRLDVGDLGLL